MSKRFVLLYSLALIAAAPAACAQTTLTKPSLSEPTPSVPPSSLPTNPPAIEALMPRAPFQSSGDVAFDAWRERFADRAIARGYAPALVTSLLIGLKPEPRITASNERQPEFVRPVWDYLASAVSSQRVATGRARYAFEQDMLARATGRFGVPGSVVIAIWGIETSYGAIRGDIDAAVALATLAYQGRRTAFGETELLALLEIMTRGEASRGQLIGSWAGAMGHTQFIPSTFLASAVDGNGDGKRNIWGDPEDALASAANYLAKSGWRRAEPWGFEVTVPIGFNWALADGSQKIGSEWATLGVTRANGLPLAGGDLSFSARILAPAGANGAAFLVGTNFQAIKTYNNSDSYALAVGLLSDRIAGSETMPTRWPFSDPPIPRSQVMELQQILARLGFDAGTPDGQAGPRTRAALQAFQASRGLTADGYPSASALDAVRKAAAPPTPS
jgi:membrane-bound lytic murein transglycosylase B